MPKFYEEHTYEDALKVIKKQVRHWEKGESFAYHLQPLKTAVKALEKQIPKKPFIPWDSMSRNFVCPECQHSLSIHQNFCTECGQALDWEVNDV